MAKTNINSFDWGRVTPLGNSAVLKIGEQANCDPTTELAALMDTQRQLEANANMIRYQDQMLNRLVNDVAKIG